MRQTAMLLQQGLVLWQVQTTSDTYAYTCMAEVGRRLAM